MSKYSVLCFKIMLPVEFKLFQQDDVVDSVKDSSEIILCMKTWNLRKKRKNIIVHVLHV